MIEWKEYEVIRGVQFPKNEPYLVTNGKFVVQAFHYHQPKSGYQWWDANGTMIAGVTHYAAINFPIKED